MMDSNTLTNVLKAIQAACGANGDILSNAKSLFLPLMTIDFVLAFTMQAFGIGGNGYLSAVFSKIMKYGFWIWVVNNWGMLINALKNSLTTVGASFGDLDPGILERPSQIIDKGFVYAVKYYDTMSEISLLPGNSLAKNAFLWIVCVIAMIGIFAAFAYIALNALVTYIEFYIISALLLIFIPFALLDKTSRFSENAIGYIMGTGVKLMMMGAILSLCINVTDSFLNVKPNIVGANPWTVPFTSVVIAWVFAFLAVHVPELASGAMSGSPSLSGNMATASMAGAMSGGIAGHIAGKVAGVTSKGSNAVAKAAGAFSEGTGGNISAAGSAFKSAAQAFGNGDKAGARQAFGSGMKSLGKGVGGGALSMGKGIANTATSGLQDSFDKGQGAAQAKFGQYHPTSPGTGSAQERARTSGQDAKAAANKDQLS